MKSIYLAFTLFFVKSQLIFDFNSKSDISNWFVTNDVVMGGLSSSSIKLDDKGNGVFSGLVSTENNGGFAMVRLRKDVKCSGTKIELRIKGDGKKYQFRIKPNDRNKYFYIQTFKTSGEWEIISLPLKDFYPSFRGVSLEMPNFNYSRIQEFAILIGNKKTENFKIIIDKIKLK